MNTSAYLILVTIVVFLFSSCVHASGMNEESKVKILDWLKSYEPEEKSQAAFSTQQANLIKEHCERENYSFSQKCIEMKYMNGDLYKVSIAFKNQHEATESLPRNFAHDSKNNKGDKLDAYLARWSGPVLEEFVGEDYQKYSSTKLESLNPDYINVWIEVINPEELEELFKDNRIVSIYHVAFPSMPLEEIAP